MISETESKDGAPMGRHVYEYVFRRLFPSLLKFRLEHLLVCQLSTNLITLTQGFIKKV